MKNLNYSNGKGRTDEERLSSLIYEEESTGLGRLHREKAVSPRS